MKKLQIDEDLWWDLVEYHIAGKRDPELMLRIRDGIERKMGAIERRALYVQSKTAQNPEVRELARRTYLDEAGVPEDYRR